MAASGGHREVEIRNGACHIDEKDIPQPTWETCWCPWVPGGGDMRHRVYGVNKIESTKYTLLNFFPKNLYEQCMPWLKPANFYFICIAVLQSIGSVSTTQGKPTILMPLLFVIGVTMIKDWIEDSKRREQDRAANEAKYKVYRDGKWVDLQSQQILVGDFVLIPEDGRVPCDIFVLGSGAEAGDVVFVDTKDLDGETNLKPKSVPAFMLFQFPETKGNRNSVARFSLKLSCESPEDPAFTDMGEWSGQVHISNPKPNPETDVKGVPRSKFYVNMDNFILRTCVVRNTPWVIGMATYTGEQTKIRKNNAKNQDNLKIKTSQVFRHMNYGFATMGCLQLICCFFAAVMAGVYQARLKGNSQPWGDSWYLALDDSPFLAGFQRFFTWFIICKDFLPISLYVSLEMVQFCQAKFMDWDAAMAYKDEEGEWQFAAVQTSRLNEELAQVHYVFSDKTGTLTQNRMDFKKCVIGNAQYGTKTTTAGVVRQARLKNKDVAEALRRFKEDTASAKVHPFVEFDEKERVRLDEKKGGVQAQMIQEYFYALSLNNSVFPKLKKASKKRSKKDKRAVEENLQEMEVKHDFSDPRKDVPLQLDSSSPDEKALVYFAQYMGYEVYHRSEGNVTLKRTGLDGKQNARWFEHFEDICLIDFSSKRKRMTVIVSPKFGPDKGKLKIYCKGADSYVKALLRGSKTSVAEIERVQKHLSYTFQQLEGFGGESLRTLVVASATKERSWWFGDEKTGQGGWKDKWEAAYTAKDPTAKEDLEKIETAIEKDAEMDLIGATAIEDKLQDGVPEAIKSLLEASIKIWVLTGDNVATAINIGISCNLLEADMTRDGRLFVFDDFDKKVKDLEPREMKNPEFVEAVDAEVKKLNSSIETVVSRTEQKALAEGKTSQEANAAAKAKRKFLIDDCTNRVKRSFITQKKGRVLQSKLRAAMDQVPHLKAKFPGQPLGLALHGNVWKVLQHYQSTAVEGPLVVSPKSPRASPVETGKEQEDEHSLQYLFYTLARECKSVLGCRLEPKEKAEIVKMMQRREKVTTLAIGDGNNDTVMIKTAEIGVGIRGVEGTSAVSASDYVISQFRFLTRLILVHGRLNNRRICQLVYYIFYKTSIAVWSVLFFGFYSAFSGQFPYLDWMYQLHNIAFTAMPIIIFAIFDRDIEPPALESNPYIYVWSRGPILYGFHKLLEWAIFAFLHAVICFFIPWYSFEVTSPESSGQSFGFQSTMLVVYCCVVVVTNQKLAFYAAHWNWAWHLFFWGSIAILFIAILVFSTSTLFAIGGIDYYYVGFRLFSMARFWMTLILTCGLACMLDYSRAVWVHFYPDRTRVFIEAMHLGKPVFDPDAVTVEDLKSAKSADARHNRYMGSNFSFTPNVRDAYSKKNSINA